jgi:hypothetical protein
MILDLNITNGSTADRVNQTLSLGLPDKTQLKLLANLRNRFHVGLKV